MQNFHANIQHPEASLATFIEDMKVLSAHKPNKIAYVIYELTP